MLCRKDKQLQYLSKITKTTILAASVIVLGACGTSLVPEANKTDLSGTDFNHHLARNYRDFANFEAYEMYDWRDGILYADKSLASAAGEPPTPDDMNSRSIDGEANRVELRDARRSLITALDNGAASITPQNAASAQANFDCWVEQQEEGWQLDDIAACKDGFWTAMKATDLAMAPKPAETAMAQPAAVVAPSSPEKPAMPETAIYQVFFEWDKATMTPEGFKAIDEVMTRLGGTNHTVELLGHTDTSGTEAYNMQLSEARAETVKRQLIARGVSPDSITTRWIGETGTQRVATADGVRESRNRWVGIDLQGALTTQ